MLKCTQSLGADHGNREMNPRLFVGLFHQSNSNGQRIIWGLVCGLHI